MNDYNTTDRNDACALISFGYPYTYSVEKVQTPKATFNQVTFTFSDDVGGLDEAVRQIETGVAMINLLQFKHAHKELKRVFQQAGSFN